ncbi:hypothetical protein SAMN04488693_101280 [Arthrobacter subterraneus]|uniref:Uncharacterized protein n=1 Tax=Arthrobacter subterraneus TaxID=335973 RepID=A0A1G8CJ36_9MICC|nr:hypothetical protein SAMN04488693_101280 [Arthrobacter subterraneus]
MSAAGLLPFCRKVGAVQIYSSSPFQRTWQVLIDLFAIAAIAVAWFFSRATFDAISNLAVFGRGMEDAGSQFQSTMTDAAEGIGGVPLIGDQASAPFLSAAEAGGILITAGQDQQDSVAQAAAVIGWAILLLPILILIPMWLIPRVRFVVRSTRTRRLQREDGGRELLALRALVLANPSQLRKVSPDPVRAWREGDPAAVDGLARLALKHAGVKAG